jgi:hypothetical protein
MEVHYPAADYPLLHTQEAGWVRRLYWYGSTDGPLTGADATHHGERMWENAEEFLDYLDTAADDREGGEPNPLGQRLEKITREVWSRSIGAKTLRSAARRLIAAECCTFLEGVDVRRRERWEPFRSWVRSLTPDDTIVTFNYDRVVERLHEAQNLDARDGNGQPSLIHVVTPGNAQDPGVWSGCAPLLKLHGSVDWRKDLAGGRVVVSVQDERYALTCPDEHLAVATPGPSKRREAQGFQELWELAKRALRIADAIVFVGFRFPETDADARKELLGAIGGNVGKGDRYNERDASQLSLHTVLGNGPTSGRDAERLAALLRFSCRGSRDEARRDTARFHVTGVSSHRFTVDSHPLLAQDFFSVERRKDLL